MTKEITPLDVVKVFLKLQDSSDDIDSGDVITNLKAQKLIYYAQGFHLAKFNKPFFSDDFTAWVHGPVVKNLYKQLKKFCSKQLELDLADLDLSKFNSEQLDLLIKVYKTFGQYSAWKLRDMTHSESPWRGTTINKTITKESIKQHFDNILAIS